MKISFFWRSNLKILGSTAGAGFNQNLYSNVYSSADQAANSIFDPDFEGHHCPGDSFNSKSWKSQRRTHSNVPYKGPGYPLHVASKAPVPEVFEQLTRGLEICAQLSINFTPRSSLSICGNLEIYLARSLHPSCMYLWLYAIFNRFFYGVDFVHWTLELQMRIQHSRISHHTRDIFMLPSYLEWCLPFIFRLWAIDSLMYLREGAERVIKGRTARLVFELSIVVWGDINKRLDERKIIQRALSQRPSRAHGVFHPGRLSHN